MMKTKTKRIKRATVTLAAAITLAANFACHYNSFEKPNVNAAPTAENKQTAFESNLKALRTADLKYIFAFRRTDGGVFDGEDKKYLRTNLPTTNRIYMSDEGRAYLIGSNYKFPAENLEVLRLRFNIEDFSTAK